MTKRRATSRSPKSAFVRCRRAAIEDREELLDVGSVRCGRVVVQCFEVAARAGVAHAWLLNPAGQTLEVLSLERGKWAVVDRLEGRMKVRARPFDAVELELGALWI